MPNPPSDEEMHPALDYDRAVDTVRLSGPWSLGALAGHLDRLRPDLKRNAQSQNWDLRAVTALDSASAAILWRVWGLRRPAGLAVRDEHAVFFRRLADVSGQPAAKPQALLERFGAAIAARLSGFADHAAGMLTLIGQFVLDLGHLLGHPQHIPWREISAHITHTGTRAMPITALVGLLIGVVLSYLSAIQLKWFGAEAYIVDILGLSITRELGPLLAAILVAGRSGSAITAQLGIMRVTEELDALTALGISHSLRLILPRVLALAVTMPLLVVWTDATALLGGMLSARMDLDIGFLRFLAALPDALPIANFWIGVGKGVAFGVTIAIVASHYGLRVRPNTESLGRETTNAVVAAITLVILLDAVFAIAFRSIGF